MQWVDLTLHSWIYNMIDFMIIGLPRSGTTWAANWLTAGDVFCVHDPLYKVHYSEWDTNRVHFPHPMLYNNIGVSCTGIWRWPEFVNAHPANKIVVIRDLDEVNREMEKLGFPELPGDADLMLRDIEAPHVPYTDLFDPERAPFIWSKLVGDVGYCPLRHAQLCEFNVQPNFQKIEPDKEVTRKLYNELLMK